MKMYKLLSRLFPPTVGGILKRYQPAPDEPEENDLKISILCFKFSKESEHFVLLMKIKINIRRRR